MIGAQCLGGYFAVNKTGKQTFKKNLAYSQT